MLPKIGGCSGLLKQPPNEWAPFPAYGLPEPGQQSWSQRPSENVPQKQNARTVSDASAV